MGHDLTADEHWDAREKRVKVVLQREEEKDSVHNDESIQKRLKWSSFTHEEEWRGHGMAQDTREKMERCAGRVYSATSALQAYMQPHPASQSPAREPGTAGRSRN